jgi:hypothetical protein
MPRSWTDEDRKRQAEAIKRWKPWEHSTGAITPEGKQSSKMNALKHGAFGTDIKRLEKLLSDSISQNLTIQTRSSAQRRASTKA